MIKNTPIMLPDEPTSITDLINEYEIPKALFRLCKDKTLDFELGN